MIRLFYLKSISTESPLKVKNEKIHPGEYFNSDYQTDFYSSVKTHTPLIDLGKCEKLSDLPSDEYPKIRKVYEDSQKFINVHARVRKSKEISTIIWKFEISQKLNVLFYCGAPIYDSVVNEPYFRILQPAFVRKRLRFGVSSVNQFWLLLLAWWPLWFV